MRLAAKASTPAEHRALEEYFLTLAKRYTAEANEHVAMAQAYRGTRIAQAAVHHDRLGQVCRGMRPRKRPPLPRCTSSSPASAGNGCRFRPGRRFRWPGGNRIKHTVTS